MHLKLQKNMKKILAIVILFNILIFSQDASALKSKIDQILSDPFFQSANASVEIYDLTSHETLYSKNENLLLNPASNMKILTTTTALLFLEPDFQFNTSLYYTGNILNKTLYGDIYLVGGGDPLFTTDDFNSLIKRIKKLGITEITGNIYADVSWKDSLYWGNGWMWDDNPSTDAPYLSALNIDANSIQVFVAPSTPGQKAKIYLKPETGFVDVLNNTVTQNDSASDYKINRQWMERKNTITVEGNVKNEPITDSADVWEGINIYNPPLYFTTLFYEKLLLDSIKVDGITDIKTAPDFATKISTFTRSIDSVIVNVNKPSYNLGAEMILYSLAVRYFGKPATAENGAKVVKNMIDLIGLNSESYSIADGSGVSRYDLISAHLLITILKYLYENRQDLYKKLYYSFPIAGVDGTLSHRMKNTSAENNVHAKTGTLSGVSSLTGYVTSRNDHQIAFSILIENYVGKSSAARNYEDKICELLADYE
jgi:serine-type D-Ala-D-Ala carboxypeptidase/endopeptidase (penicillin-binding protein 4)